MKIALCYTGFLRTWDRCCPNHYENIIVPNDHDISAYFYTYENPLLDRLPFHGRSRFKYQWVQCPHPFYDDPFAAHKYDSNRAGETKVHQVLNMMHNNLVGFSLIPKGYDVYVRIRPDLSFNGPLKFPQVEPNTVYIPKGQDYRGLNDQFAFGDYDTMRKYFSVYLNCEALWNEGAMFNSEVLHLANLNKLGVNIVRLEEPQHDIIR